MDSSLRSPLQLTLLQTTWDPVKMQVSIQQAGVGAKAFLTSS